MEGRPQGEAPAHGRGGVRAAGAQPPARPQRRLDRGGHAVRGVFGAAGGIVKVVGDEAQDEALGRRPGQGVAAGGQRPGLEIGEIGGHGAQGVGAHALAGEMAQRLDLAVAEEPGQPVAAAERQHGGQRVELEGRPRLGVGRRRSTGRGRGSAARGGEGGHGASGPTSRAFSARAASASRLSSVASGAPSRSASSK